MITGIWTQRTLYTYIPEEAPEIIFYYKPLAEGEQEAKRLRYKNFVLVYDFMEDIFMKRMYMFGANPGEPSQRFKWPSGREEQEVLMSNIPKPVILEAGARILGWVRGEGESPKVFIDRIIDDLAQS